MIAKRPTYDVFLSHSQADSGVAKVVRRALEDAGYSVFSSADTPSKSEFETAFREAISESRALLVVLSRSYLSSPWLMFELGAAASWSKPVYLLLDGLTPGELPQAFKSLKSTPISRFQTVIDQIAQSWTPLTDSEADALRTSYSEVGLPVDRLSGEPDVLDELTRRFNAAARSSRTSGVVLRELLRMRKSGKLPRLRHRASAGKEP
jgi:TIR domain